jgi:hypothetical protein
MKQPKRDFVVEYKSGRHRPVTPQINSIWGDLDLKSVAQEVERDLPGQSTGIDGPAEVALPRDSAQHIAAETNAPTNIISPPNDENAIESVDSGTPVDHDGLIDGEEAIGTNDARGSAECEATGEPVGLEPGGAEHKLRRVRQAGASAGGRRVKQRLAKPKLALLSEADRELADLLKLEEENCQLRRLLVAKLREENNWLHDRLQRG